MHFTILFICIYCKYSVILSLKIGGLFDTHIQNAAFQLAVERIDDETIPFDAEYEPISKYNGLNVTDAVCNLFTKKVVGIFGPSSLLISQDVQYLCDKKEIPHIETHWDNKGSRDNCLVNLYPHPPVLSQVYVDIVRGLNWKAFTVVYEDDRSLKRIGKLLSMYEHNEYNIVVGQLRVDQRFGYRSMLTTLKKSGETYFVLDCSLEILEDVLQQMQQVGLLTENYNYFITNLDFQAIDFQPFQFGGANITGLSLLNTEDPQVKEAEERLQEITETEEKLTVDSALIIDSVQLFYETIRESASSQLKNMPALDCSNKDNWEYGYTLINFMKTNSINGLTGPVKFDTEGFRSDFILNVIEVTTTGLDQIGTWKDGVFKEQRVFRENTMEEEHDEYTLQDKDFIVIICLTPPYAMLKDTVTQLSGNDRYEGFCIDLIQKLSVVLGFKYTFVEQQDGNNGNFNQTTGEWDGMIKEVIDRRADLAIIDLTITSERESAVDFTMPFMNLGISILYRKPAPVPPSLFMFISPFSWEVWLLLVVACFVVSISFFLMARLSPSEWTNPYPCVSEPAFLVNQFSFRNSLWFAIGSLMQQGSDIAPIGISTRMTAGVWWFFTLIMMSSYTANMSAFLTVETLNTPFNNIEELAHQEVVKYGAKRGGATVNYFRDSKITTYNQIYKYTQENPEVMTNDNDEGVRRVKTENYAFLMESTSIEYITERNCSLAQVGGLLDDKGYGIAMRKDSPYRNALSQAILKLQESGDITNLKIKWWKVERGGGNCGSRSSESRPTSLNLQNVGGVFLVLAIGSALALLCIVIQVCFTTYKLARKQHISFGKELMKELKFTVDIKKTQKVVKASSNDIGTDYTGLD